MQTINGGMTCKTIKLFELPGIRECKEAFQNPLNHQHPDDMYLRELLYNTSNQLFCISENDTYLDDADPRDYDEYELNYDVCDLSAEEAQPFWAAIGWDLMGPDGRELDVADRFKRQIIATMRGLVEGAKFCPDGNGKPAYSIFGERISGTEAFEQGLQADLEQWRTKNVR